MIMLYRSVTPQRVNGLILLFSKQTLPPQIAPEPCPLELLCGIAFISS
jgi:hypothetical protein